MSEESQTTIELPHLAPVDNSDSPHVFAPQEEWRPLRRWSVDIQAIVRIAEQPYACDVHDLSPNGARILVRGAKSLAPGTALDLEMDGFEPISAAVRYSLGGYMGLRFQYDEYQKAEFARRLTSLRPRRRPHRQGLDAEASLAVRGTLLKCLVQDLSETGARLLVDDERSLVFGDQVLLKIEGYAEVVATVRRLSDRQVGLMFLEDLKDGPSP